MRTGDTKMVALNIKKRTDLGVFLELEMIVLVKMIDMR